MTLRLTHIPVLDSVLPAVTHSQTFLPVTLHRRTFKYKLFFDSGALIPTYNGPLTLRVCRSEDPGTVLDGYGIHCSTDWMAIQCLQTTIIVQPCIKWIYFRTN